LSAYGRFSEAEVWEKAHPIAVRVHKLAQSMRSSRYASLRNQIIRAAESIPSNIVEGSRKATNADFARFLGYALNSASELEYQLMLARDIGAIEEEESLLLINALTEIRKMLHGLIRRVRSSPMPDRRRRPERE